MCPNLSRSLRPPGREETSQPTCVGVVLSAVLASGLGGVPEIGAQEETGPRFELKLRKQDGGTPCGGSIEADARGLWDDRTGGVDFFFDTEIFQNTELARGQKVPNLVTFDGETFDDESDPPLRLTDCELAFEPSRGDGEFTRGDPDGDGRVTVTDVVLTVCMILGIVPLRFGCDDALDLNGDGSLNLSDAVRLLLYLFREGEPPAAPFPGCGTDPTEDALECNQHSTFCRDVG